MTATAALAIVLPASLAVPSPPALARQEEASDRPSLVSSEHYEKDYYFSRDWFSRNIEVWTELLAPYRGKPDVRYLEIGLFEGRSALWVLEQILTHPTSHLTGIDVFFRPNLEETWLTNLRRSGHAERVTTIKDYSFDAMRELPLASFDVIYIDGSHIAPDVLADATLAWGLLKEGGLLIFDDYNYGKGLPRDLRPHESIDAFVSAYRNQLEVAHRAYQIAVRKTGPPCPERQDCIPVGGCVYVWNAGTLHNGDTGEKLALTEAEREILEALILGRGEGEVDFTPDPATRADPVYGELAERLGL